MSKSILHTVLPLLLLFSACVVLASGDDAMATAQASVTEIKIDNFTMSPQTVTVVPGTTVRWTNADDIPHTIVSEDHAFKSRVMDTGEQFTYTFAAAGTFKYFCSIHPHMTGTIVVK
jgi:plastocyanin